MPYFALLDSRSIAIPALESSRGASMNETVPILLGATSGLFVGASTARYRFWLWLAASVLLGLLATVITGEWKVSWAFLLIDIPLVAFASAAVFVVARSARLRWDAEHRYVGK